MTTNAPFADLAAKARRVHDAVTLVRGRARSADGHVTIEVDAAGHITALTITDSALSANGAAALAAAVTDTHREACAEAAHEAQALRDELTSDPLVSKVIGELDAEATTVTRPPAEPAHEDEGYYRGGFLHRA